MISLPRPNPKKSHPSPRPTAVSPGQEPPPGASAIHLTRGWVAWVDEEDFEPLSVAPWQSFVSKNSPTYATTRVAGEPRERGKTTYMHCLILPPPAGMQVDHRVHRQESKVVDNRKSNLRVCTQHENQRNASVRKFLPEGDSIASAFKGVTRCRKRWQARIRVDSRSMHLGMFREEANAAMAYDLAAVKHFGEFALTNFPVPGSTNWIYGESP